ncbi:MAG: FHA domain-containing protein [Minisyncoccia bacterium]
MSFTDLIEALKSALGTVPNWLISLTWWYLWGAFIGLIIVLAAFFIVLFDLLKRGRSENYILHIILFIVYLLFPILFIIFRFNIGFITGNFGLFLFITIASLIAPIASIVHLILNFLVTKKEVSPFEYKRIETGAETIPAPQVEMPKEAGYTTEELQPQNIVDKTISLKRKKLPAIAWLVMIEGEREGEDFRITKNDFKIGRDPNLQCDLVLSDSTVSKEHCKIKVDENNRVFIYDLASENGTFVNDKEISGPIELKDNDIIKIGKTKFMFKFASVKKE